MSGPQFTRQVPHDIHPTIELFPIGTKIAWMLSDTGPEKKGEIKGWTCDCSGIEILDFADNQVGLYHPSDVFINAVLQQVDEMFVSINDGQEFLYHIKQLERLAASRGLSVTVYLQ